MTAAYVTEFDSIAKEPLTARRAAVVPDGENMTDTSIEKKMSFDSSVQVRYRHMIT